MCVLPRDENAGPALLAQVGGGSCFVTFTQTNAPHDFSMHNWEQVIWHKLEGVVQHWEMSTEESRARSEFVQVLGADEQQPTRTGLPLPTPDGVPGHYLPWSTCNTHCILWEAHIQNFEKKNHPKVLKKRRSSQKSSLGTTHLALLSPLFHQFFIFSVSITCTYSLPLKPSHSGNLQRSPC